MSATTPSRYAISVSVQPRYLPEQSDESADRFVFAYHVTIVNNGQLAAQLVSRHWIIQDGDGKVQEVRGDGVVGEQPNLMPGEGFQYVSGTALTSPVGTMQGSYQFVGEDGEHFDAQIEPFVLSVPRTLH